MPSVIEMIGLAVSDTRGVVPDMFWRSRREVVAIKLIDGGGRHQGTRRVE
jgi:hypothetical protein